MRKEEGGGREGREGRREGGEGEREGGGEGGGGREERTKMDMYTLAKRVCEEGGRRGKEGREGLRWTYTV